MKRFVLNLLGLAVLIPVYAVVTLLWIYGFALKMIGYFIKTKVDVHPLLLKIDRFFVELLVKAYGQ